MKKTWSPASTPPPSRARSCRPRRRHRRAACARGGRPPRRHRGRPGGLVGGAAGGDRAGRRPGRRRGDRGRRPAARHGLPRRGRRGRAPGAAVERHPLGPRRRRPGRRARAAGRPGPTPSASCRSRRSPSPSCAGWPSTSRTHAARTAAVCLPHDWLTWRLARRRRLDALVTDRGDASGTGYWSPDHRRVPPRPARARRSGRDLRAARGARPGRAPAGTTAPAARCSGRAPATTPPPRSALGAAPGDVIVSIGTSGVGLRASPTAPAADATGTVAGFADATGRFLPLVVHAQRRPRARRRRADARRRPRRARPARAVGARRAPTAWCWCRTSRASARPNRPDATGALHGLTLGDSTPAHLARAAVEGLLCGLADGLDALARRASRSTGCC